MDDVPTPLLPSSAMLLEVAHTVRKRLMHWHIPDIYDVWRVDEITAFDAVGYRFRRDVEPQSEPPKGYVRLLSFEQGPFVPVDEPYPPPEAWESMGVPEQYKGKPGIAVEVPPSLTDQYATKVWMGVFQWNLNLFPSHPAVEYVQGVFDQILDLQMFVQKDIPDHLQPTPDRPYYMAGRPVPVELLDRLVNATEKLHDAVVAGIVEIDSKCPAKSSEGDRLAEAAQPRLIVDLAALTATERATGITHTLKSEQVARWLKVLAENEGKWITSTQLAGFDPELDGTRTDRLLKSLPEKLRRKIATSSHTGSKITLD